MRARLDGWTRRPSTLAWIMGITFLLLSCQLVDRALQGTLTDPLADYDVNRDTSVMLLGGQPRTLDPALTLGGPSGALGHIFSGLVQLDTDLQAQPDLAAGWEVSDDGLTYTFYLYKDAVFHDGRPVTAQDVVFSWERAAHPDTGSDTVLTYLGDIAGVTEMHAGAADTISGLRVIDDHTLEVTLRAPIVTFLPKLAYPVSFVVDEANVSQPDWEHQANGTGPFRLQEWQDDQIMVLARHEAYYGEPAQITHLVYDLGPALPLSEYETGQIDLVGIGGDALDRALDPNDPLSDELRMVVDLCTSVIGLNNRLAPFDDVRVRQAFNYALDREKLVETFGGGYNLPASGSLPPGMPASGSVAGYPFDPARARALLAEAGYADPADFPVITYYTAGYGDVGAYATAVITMLQENLGIPIEPVVLEPYTYNDQLYGGNVGHLYSSGWCADYPDPQNFLDILYHSESRQNVGGFGDTAVDELLEAARVEPDVERRLQMYAEVEQMLVAQAPVIFVSHSTSAVLVKPYLQNYVLTPMGVPQWHKVWLER